MVYTVTSVNQLHYLTNRYVDYFTFVSSLLSVQTNSFQTQSGRDELRTMLVNSVISVPAVNTRFPVDKFYIYINHPSVLPVWSALLQSTDTRNRIIENEGQNQNPTTAEQLNAVRRVDDASTAIHNNIEQLQSLLNRAEGVFDQATFENVSGLVWTASVATPVATRTSV